ncbi:CRE-AQP-2 protein [Aphelenchoides avenae]|nr:CRE-AQP-2 protein [Aphelenchus avenae]
MCMGRLRGLCAIKHDIVCALIAEFLGTLILVMVVSCVVAQSILPAGEGKPAYNQMININLGVGLGLTFGVAISARISGGHLNPAVSLMFFTFRQITIVKFFLYTLVQTAGAFFGAALAYVVYWDTIHALDAHELALMHSNSTNATMRTTAQIFASYPADHLGIVNGILDQVISTALFCLCIAHVTDPSSGYPSSAQPFIVGASLTMVGNAFALNAGYPVNPAKDFGPRLFTWVIGYRYSFSYNDFCWFWVPVVGPFIGAVVGGWIYQLAVGFQLPSAEKDYKAVTTGGAESPKTAA